jgi:hypothetical protein
MLEAVVRVLQAGSHRVLPATILKKLTARCFVSAYSFFIDVSYPTCAVLSWKG